MASMPAGRGADRSISAASDPQFDRPTAAAPLVGRRYPYRQNPDAPARARVAESPRDPEPEDHGDTRMYRLISRSFALLAGLVLALGAQAQNISIATGGTGGVYYPMGGGIAAVLSKHVPGMQATAEVTGGSVDNLKLIGSGKPYIALAMTDASQDAYRGEDKFKGNKVPLKTLDDPLPEPHARRHASRGAASPRWPT